MTRACNYTGKQLIRLAEDESIIIRVGHGSMQADSVGEGNEKSTSDPKATGSKLN